MSKNEPPTFVQLALPSEPPEDELQHVTGQQLCHAIRQLAIDQYGYMAKCVLNSWGVNSTSDFGNIVYILINGGEMRKTERDRREDFDNVFDFERDLIEGFEITMPKENRT